MIIYRKPTARRQQTVIAYCLSEISLSSGSIPVLDGITLSVKGRPDASGEESKYLFQVLLEPDDLALLAAARERFSRGGDVQRLGFSVITKGEANEQSLQLEPHERLVLRFSSLT